MKIVAPYVNMSLQPALQTEKAYYLYNMGNDYCMKIFWKWSKGSIWFRGV